jgi:hypothetical protein
MLQAIHRFILYDALRIYFCTRFTDLADYDSEDPADQPWIVPPEKLPAVFYDDSLQISDYLEKKQEILQDTSLVLFSNKFTFKDQVFPRGVLTKRKMSLYSAFCRNSTDDMMTFHEKIGYEIPLQE